MGKHRPTSTTTPRHVSEFISLPDADTDVIPVVSATTGRIPRLIVAGAVVLGTAVSAAAVAPVIPSSAPSIPSTSEIPLSRGGSVSTAVAAERLASLAASRSARASEQAAAAQVQAAAEDAARASQEAAEAAPAPAPSEAPEAAQEETLTADAPTETAPAAPAGSAAEVAVQTAMAQIGKPYVWGAEGPDTFDCSGLVLFAYQAAGISLPRVSSDQAQAGVAVSRDELQPGDLVAFYSPVSHIGIYIGNGQMVHAPEPGDVVKVTDIDVMPIAAMRRVA